MNTACINIGFARITLRSIYGVIVDIIKYALIIFFMALVFPDNKASDIVLSLVSPLL